MMIGSTDNHSGNFIQPDWLKKGQQDESGLVSSAVKPENLNQKAVEELTKKLGQESDKKEDNPFAAAYGVEISDEGYAALAQQMNAGQVEESTAQPVIAEQVESAKEEPMVYTKKLKHSHWEVPINCDPAGFISPITDAIKGIFSHIAPNSEDRFIQEGAFFMLAEDLNAYLELSGGTDASGFLGELSDKLQNMNSKNPNPLLDRILSLVEEARSGHYIDNNSEDFGTQNASAIDGYYHLVKSGQLDETALSKNMEKNFNSQAVQNMIAKFQTTMDSSILDIMMYTDPDANHLMHPALTDILSAYRSETADGHDDIMRKLSELE